MISPLKDSTNAINELRKWHNHVSGDISQLKRNLDHDPVACGSYADSLVQRMESEVKTMVETTSKIEALADTVPFEEILTHCRALLKSNEKEFEKAEDDLTQYGYVLPEESKAKRQISGPTCSPEPPAGGLITGTTLVAAAVAAAASGTVAQSPNEPPPTIQAAVTPVVKQQPKSFLANMPATPTLEDFGISETTMSFVNQGDLFQQKPPAVYEAVMTEPAPSPLPPTCCSQATKESPLKRNAIGDLCQDDTSMLKKARLDRAEEPQVEDFDTTVTLSAGATLLLQQEADRQEADRQEADRLEADRQEAEMVAKQSQPSAGLVESPEASATGGSLFPTVDAVAEEEFQTVPQYLQSMFPLKSLNECISKINEYMMDRRFNATDGEAEEDEHYDCITQSILTQDLEYGEKAKPLFHLLKNLKRFTLHKRMADVQENLYIISRSRNCS